jgi:ribosomal protein S18 acetylase RimI-like enzyme
MITSRAATTDDVPRLLEMMGAFNLLEQVPWDEAKGAPVLRRLLGDPSLGSVRVVEREGQVVGYFVLTWGFDLEWGGRDSFLTEIYLEPLARGQGLGTRMMALIEDEARANGAAAVHLMVRPENEPAVRLYERAGYRSPPRTLLSKALR